MARVIKDLGLVVGSSGNLHPIDKTDVMTSPVGIDSEGKLWSVPGSGGSGGGGSGGSCDNSKRLDFSRLNEGIIIETLEDDTIIEYSINFDETNVTEVAMGSVATLAFTWDQSDNSESEEENNDG